MGEDELTVCSLLLTVEGVFYPAASKVRMTKIGGAAELHVSISSFSLVLIRSIYIPNFPYLQRQRICDVPDGRGAGFKMKLNNLRISGRFDILLVRK